MRDACDDYVRFVESHDLLESVASSLTELAAGEIMKVRIAAFEKHYGWVEPEGLQYFLSRTRQAPADAAEGMAYVLANARTGADQERCVAALERKCEILWRLLDAIEAAHARPCLSSAAKLRRAQARIAVRPEWLDVFVPDQVPSDENALHGTVRDVLYLGETLHVLVRLPSGRDIAVGVRNEGQLTRPLMWKTGQSVAVAWKPGDCQVLEDDA